MIGEDVGFIQGLIVYSMPRTESRQLQLDARVALAEHRAAALEADLWEERKQRCVELSQHRQHLTEQQRWLAELEAGLGEERQHQVVAVEKFQAKHKNRGPQSPDSKLRAQDRQSKKAQLQLTSPYPFHKQASQPSLRQTSQQKHRQPSQQRTSEESTLENQKDPAWLAEWTKSGQQRLATLQWHIRQEQTRNAKIVSRLDERIQRLSNKGALDKISHKGPRTDVQDPSSHELQAATASSRSQDGKSQGLHARHNSQGSIPTESVSMAGLRSQDWKRPGLHDQSWTERSKPTEPLEGERSQDWYPYGFHEQHNSQCAIQTEPVTATRSQDWYRRGSRKQHSSLCAVETEPIAATQSHDSMCLHDQYTSQCAVPIELAASYKEHSSQYAVQTEPVAATRSHDSMHHGFHDEYSNQSSAPIEPATSTRSQNWMPHGLRRRNSCQHAPFEAPRSQDWEHQALHGRYNSQHPISNESAQYDGQQNYLLAMERDWRPDRGGEEGRDDSRGESSKFLKGSSAQVARQGALLMYACIVLELCAEARGDEGTLLRFFLMWRALMKVPAPPEDVYIQDDMFFRNTASFVTRQRRRGDQGMLLRFFLIWWSWLGDVVSFATKKVIHPDSIRLFVDRLNRKYGIARCFGRWRIHACSQPRICRALFVRPIQNYNPYASLCFDAMRRFSIARPRSSFQSGWKACANAVVDRHDLHILPALLRLYMLVWQTVTGQTRCSGFPPSSSLVQSDMHEVAVQTEPMKLPTQALMEPCTVQVECSIPPLNHRMPAVKHSRHSKVGRIQKKCRMLNCFVMQVTFSRWKAVLMLPEPTSPRLPETSNPSSPSNHSSHSKSPSSPASPASPASPSCPARPLAWGDGALEPAAWQSKVAPLSHSNTYIDEVLHAASVDEQSPALPTASRPHKARMQLPTEISGESIKHTGERCGTGPVGTVVLSDPKLWQAGIHTRQDKQSTPSQCHVDSACSKKEEDHVEKWTAELICREPMKHIGAQCLVDPLGSAGFGEPNIWQAGAHSRQEKQNTPAQHHADSDRSKKREDHVENLPSEMISCSLFKHNLGSMGSAGFSEPNMWQAGAHSRQDKQNIQAVYHADSGNSKKHEDHFEKSTSGEMLKHISEHYNSGSMGTAGLRGPNVWQGASHSRQGVQNTLEQRAMGKSQKDGDHAEQIGEQILKSMNGQFPSNSTRSHTDGLQGTANLRCETGTFGQTQPAAVPVWQSAPTCVHSVYVPPDSKGFVHPHHVMDTSVVPTNIINTIGTERRIADQARMASASSAEVPAILEAGRWAFWAARSVDPTHLSGLSVPVASLPDLSSLCQEDAGSWVGDSLAPDLPADSHLAAKEAPMCAALRVRSDGHTSWFTNVADGEELLQDQVTC